MNRPILGVKLCIVAIALVTKELKAFCLPYVIFFRRLENSSCHLFIIHVYKKASLLHLFITEQNECVHYILINTVVYHDVYSDYNNVNKNKSWFALIYNMITQIDEHHRIYSINTYVNYYSLDQRF